MYLKAKRRGCGIIAIHHLAILVNEKLGKVPLNIIPENSPFTRLQEFIQGSRVLSIYFNLAQP